VAAEPLSISAQTIVRIPAIIVALVGVVLALVMMKRLGVFAAVLGAAGSLFIAIDQAVNIAWVLHLSSTSTSGDKLTTLNNMYSILDPVVITIAAALIVGSFLTRRKSGPPASTPPPFNPYGAAASPFPAAPQPFPAAPQQPFPPAPQQPFPPAPNQPPPYQA